MTSRISSLAVAVVYLLVAYYSGGSWLMLKILGLLIVALACIWFGDSLGSLTGFSVLRMIDISEKTPGSLVSFVGWLILIVVPGIICVIYLRS